MWKLPHQLEFAVGRDKTNGVFSFEFGEFDALVELAVIDDHDGLARPSRVIRAAQRPDPAAAAARHQRFALRVHHYLVVDSEFAFGHARQVRLHNNFAGDMGR